MNSSKITIVIWVHNRTKHLKSLLNYLIKSNYRIIVSDSSKKNNFDFSKYEITYLKYDTSINYYEKIKDTLEKVETDYFCWQNDDDRIIIEGIQACEKF